jgi:hypothetical protein
MAENKNRVGQANHSQYKITKGPKARESGYEASYEYTTGNEVGEKDNK